MIAPELHVPAAYPLRSQHIWSRTHALWALALVLPLSGLYAATLGTAVGWWDSGELLASARTLSVAHRPGFPLYVVFGRVAFGWLEDPRWFANVFSALCALVAVVCTWRGLCILVGDRPFSRLWVAAGGWLVAASPLFWRQAIRIEVYAPAYACLALAFLLAASAQRAPDPPAAQRRFLGAMYLLALATCLHSAVTAPVGFAVVSLFFFGSFRPSLKQWGWAGLCVLAGWSLYLYVPLRAPLSPYVWGQPDSLSGFLAYFSASDSYGIIAREASGTFLRAGALVNVLAAESSIVLAILGFAGMLQGAHRGRGLRAPILLFLSSLAAAASVVSFVIPDNADMQAYLVPALVALWWGWAQLDPAFLRRWLRPAVAWRTACVACMAMALSAVAVGAASGLAAVRSTRLGLSDRWGLGLLSGAHTGDLVVIQDANTEFLLRGLAHSQGDGPQVTVLNAGLAEAAWYREWWQSRHDVSSEAVDAGGWARDIARTWRSRGARVLVDYGTPGWMPSELAPSGMLCLWDGSGSGASQAPSPVPEWRAPGAGEDPEWVRSAVWFYFRLAQFYRARGNVSAAVKACDEGLFWSPTEEALIQARAELAESEHLLGTLQAPGDSQGAP